MPQSNEDFLRRLGLTDVDTKVYIATLDGGLVSLGEIQQLTEINDLGRILESVRDLIDVGLVKKAQGTMRRYYATLPFFRETLSVEREFKFALEAMLQSLNQAKTNTTQNRERIVAVKFPEIVDELLDRYYKDLLAPVLNELEQIREYVKSSVLPFIKEVDGEHTKLKDEVNQLIKPLEDFSQLLNQSFDLALTKQGGKLEDYLSDRRQSRLGLLKKGHSAISTHLQTITTEISNLVENLKSIQQNLAGQTSNFSSVTNEISSKITEFNSAASMINDAKKELQAELVVAREQVKRAINSETGNPTEKVDEIFANLSGKISPINFSSDDMATTLTSVQSSIENFQATMTEVVSNFDQSIQSIEGQLLQSFEQLKKEMTDTFNQLNDNDEDSLIELKTQLETEISQLGDSIRGEGQQVQIKVEENLSSIRENLDKKLQRYQEILASLYTRPENVIKPFLETWVDDIAAIIEDFKSKSDEALIEILEPIQELEEGTFSTLTERIGFVRAMIEGRSNDIQQILDHAKEFDFTKSADTSVVVGLPAIYASLTDLMLRTKTKVTVVTPNLDLELVEIARTLKSTIRVSLVTDIDPEKDARLVSKLEEMGRINLRYYPKRDLYACIRDSEEIVFGYINEGEKTVGLRTSTPSIVGLLEDRLNETVIRNSKQF